MRFIVLAVVVASAAAQGAMPTTQSGKACKTECEASLFSAYKCDSCGSSHCIYPGNPSFETQSFSEKMDYFWTKIKEDPHTDGKYPSVLGVITQSSQTSFYNKGDEMPKGRSKAIHGIGAICPFKMDNSADSPYTGLFQPGHVEGLIRMGSAVDYSNGGLTPGLGIKFPRTGRLSGNYVALHSLDFGQSWNFFASNQSNHIPGQPKGIQQKVIIKKFNQASNCPSQVGLSDMATIAQDGSVAASPKFPFKLFLVPSAEVQTPTTPKTVQQVNAEMMSTPVGTTLYTVYACAKAAGAELTPTGSLEADCGEPLKLAAMVTTDKCTSSVYGDKSFQIRHQPVEEDWEADPSILRQEGYNAGVACGWGATEKGIKTPPSRCDMEGEMLSDDANLTTSLVV